MDSHHHAKEKVFRLDDHKPTPFTTEHVQLHFQKHEDGIYTLDQKSTWLRTKQGEGHHKIEFDLKNPHTDEGGKKINEPFLLSVGMNGTVLSPDSEMYTYDEKAGKLTIVIDSDEDAIDLEFKTRLDPANNRSMMGLYKTGDIDMTQFESNGFVNITPFYELRTDILPTLTVIADAPIEGNPTLLSNGNLVSSQKLGNGYHRAVYENPVRGPNYIVAFAAGEFDMVEDNFVTRSGKNVRIPLYTEEKDMAKNGHAAIDAIKRFFKFDEENFDAEYDLDNFKILAVSKFQFGAMENKGFEISQDDLVLLHPETSTYDDMHAVYLVVGHEGAHNLSGNRTTIENFMHIGQKEGLTTLRQQMFMASLGDPVTERINDAQILRHKQFPTDDTPMARPILPDEVDNINLCYDGVAYEKSAEVKRMMATMMGWDTFKQGVAHYFKKHDMQAASMQDFVTAIEEKSGMNLSGQFFEWYKQSGHPHITAKGSYDAEAKTYTLTMKQETPPTTDQPTKNPMFIPVKMALVNARGEDMPTILETDTNREMPSERVLHFTEAEQTFVFEGVEEEPAYHSLFRDLSAPVSVEESGLTDNQLYEQMHTDPNRYNRWEAVQTLYMKEMKRLYTQWDDENPPAIDSRLTDGLRGLVADPKADPMFISKILALPDYNELESAVENPVKAGAIASVIGHLKKEVGKSLYDDMNAALDRVHDGVVRDHKIYDYNLHGAATLKRTLLSYMIAANPEAGMEKAATIGNSGDRMDRMMALRAVIPFKGEERDALVQGYFDRYAGMDMQFRKWMSMVARENSDDVFEKVKSVTELPAYDRYNGKHAYQLYGGLTSNYAQFHRPDGKGYEALADGVIAMEKLKVGSSLAGRLLQEMAGWRNYASPNSDRMLEQLKRVSEQPELSGETRSVLKKLLPQEESPSSGMKAAP